MAAYRKKPVEVEAVQLCWETWEEVCDFLGGVVGEHNPARFVGADRVSDTCGEVGPQYIELTVPTLEGDRVVRHGDWIIKGDGGELCSCKPDVFAATYEPADDPSSRWRGFTDHEMAWMEEELLQCISFPRFLYDEVRAENATRRAGSQRVSA